MGLSLSKGQKLSLSKNAINLKKVIVGLGWDTKKFDSSDDFDLDASAYLLNSSLKVNHDYDFVFYGNKQSRCESVRHSGDNRTGSGEGDDESLIVDLEKVPELVRQIRFVVTIHEAKARRQNFGLVENAYIRIVNMENNKELLRYNLTDDFSTETAIEFADLYKENGEWMFHAIGQGTNGGLLEFCQKYGVDVE